MSVPTVKDPIYGSETVTAEAPQGYTPGETNSSVTEGDKTISTKEVITEIKNSDGKVIGYTITTTTTTSAPSGTEPRPRPRTTPGRPP